MISKPFRYTIFSSFSGNLWFFSELIQSLYLLANFCTSQFATPSVMNQPSYNISHIDKITILSYLLFLFILMFPNHLHKYHLKNPNNQIFIAKVYQMNSLYIRLEVPKPSPTLGIVKNGEFFGALYGEGSEVSSNFLRVDHFHLNLYSLFQFIFSRIFYILLFWLYFILLYFLFFRKNFPHFPNFFLINNFFKYLKSP